jgi:uncharacterized membrane protein YphA (DoxX/SURF4 family)
LADVEKIIRLVSRLLGVAIGLLFVYAAWGKVLDPAQFAADIANFRLLPHAAGGILALYLPWLEIICGTALIVHKAHRGALLITAAMCLMYLGALASAKVRGLDIECGCFGPSHPHSLAVSLMLDSALLAGLIFLLTVEFGRSNNPP